ncbi:MULTISPECIES: sensor histidine kinase [unclassified Streptomyces]|uniref:sensor histidine kinase n=1 Tax=unclassified Streptomyces TaxID=2593676 RepID=UPI0004BF96D8|nr:MULTISPECIES: histidine kinase [unclassified Streptomyces]
MTLRTPRPIRGWQRAWHARSKAARVELQSVIVWRVTPWVFVATWMDLPLVGSLRHDALSRLLSALLVLVGVLQVISANRLVRPVLDHYLGRDVLPARALWTPVVLFFLALVLISLLHGLDAAAPWAARLALGAILLSFGTVYAMVVPVRTYVRNSAILGVLLMSLYGLLRADLGEAAGTAAVTVFGAGLAMLGSRCGAWTLAVLWEAERSRDIEARLAVAEERLRFGRDLHDVMGRNLAVIALKSELAVQLARRGRPEAESQMIEVQRIAQESQREVREVVRGYRGADLGVELSGARGVLTAAGIDCTVTGPPAGGLPTPVQSALAWVVREAVTNVLRHGNPQRCTVALRTAGDRIELSVENDGAPVPETESEAGTGSGSGSGSRPGQASPGGSAGRGSGLAGLRERLAEIGGTLRAGPAGAGVFRLTAEVPLPGPSSSPSAGGGSFGAHAPDAEAPPPSRTRAVPSSPSSPSSLSEVTP